MTASTVRVERPNRATLGTRVAHYAMWATVRQGLHALAMVGRLSPIDPNRFFAISSFTDAPAAVLRPPRGTGVREVPLPTCRGEWLWDTATAADPLSSQDGGALLYFHGGGYIACGLSTHRRLVAKIARASGLPAFNVAYRQLPAHFTDSLDDAVAAYQYLLDLGFAPDKIIVSGDSAGGGLAFRLALATRERGLPMPGAISAIAPWADLDPCARNEHSNATTCSMLAPLTMEVVARAGFGELDPAWSAVNHDMTGMPPTLVQVGSLESLLADAEQLAAAYRLADAPMRLQIWDMAPHVHHVASDLLTDARAAIADLGAFHREVVESTQALPIRRIPA